MARILLIGGHGKVALLSEPMLVAAGHHVTAVIRNPRHEPAVRATGAEPLVVDVETFDTEQLTNLVSGNDVVVWSAGAGGGDPERTFAVDRDAAIRSIDAAVAAGPGWAATPARQRAEILRAAYEGLIARADDSVGPLFDWWTQQPGLPMLAVTAASASPHRQQISYAGPPPVIPRA
mgnify:CR=1 FL=1